MTAWGPVWVTAPQGRRLLVSLHSRCVERDNRVFKWCLESSFLSGQILLFYIISTYSALLEADYWLVHVGYQPVGIIQEEEETQKQDGNVDIKAGFVDFFSGSSLVTCTVLGDLQFQKVVEVQCLTICSIQSKQWKCTYNFLCVCSPCKSKQATKGNQALVASK